jgi:hypothetical protein
LEHRLRDRPAVCLVADEITEVPGWMRSHLSAKGYRYRIHRFNRMSVTLFERTAR